VLVLVLETTHKLLKRASYFMARDALFSISCLPACLPACLLPVWFLLSLCCLFCLYLALSTFAFAIFIMFVGYRYMARRLLEVADELCDGRIVFSHEGGYSNDYSPYCGLAVVEECFKASAAHAAAVATASSSRVDAAVVESGSSDDTLFPAGNEVHRHEAYRENSGARGWVQADDPCVWHARRRRGEQHAVVLRVHECVTCV
jgi:hypothetical protein